MGILFDIHQNSGACSGETYSRIEFCDAPTIKK